MILSNSALGGSQRPTDGHEVVALYPLWESRPAPPSLLSISVFRCFSPGGELSWAVTLQDLTLLLFPLCVLNVIYNFLIEYLLKITWTALLLGRLGRDPGQSLENKDRRLHKTLTNQEIGVECSHGVNKLQSINQLQVYHFSKLIGSAIKHNSVFCYDDSERNYHVLIQHFKTLRWVWVDSREIIKCGQSSLTSLKFMTRLSSVGFQAMVLITRIFCYRSHSLSSDQS